MTYSTSHEIPQVLEAIQSDLDATDGYIAQLENELDPTVRAEISMELIRRTSMVEDTMERAVYDSLAATNPELAEHARSESTRLRETMVPVDHRTRHVAAMDVHQSDPEGFERELAMLCDTLGEVRAWEAEELYPKLNDMSGEDSQSLHDAVDHAHKHASEHPSPAGPVARIIHKVGAKMDRYPDIADREP